jgi:MoaA/NifB/PqqE/SkfB family radical SAM enzyme
MTTLRLVRSHFPDMILCLSSNGLNVAPYVEELAELGVSHVTITLNALDTGVTEKYINGPAGTNRAISGKRLPNCCLKIRSWPSACSGNSGSR